MNLSSQSPAVTCTDFDAHGYDVAYEEIIGNKADIRRITGVYLLLDGPKVVYVGQSSNVMARLGVHLQEGSQKHFDGYYIIECPQECLSLLEAHYIIKFAPRYNGSLPPQDAFKSTLQLKKLLNANAWQIKKFVKARGIENSNGWWKYSDFKDFHAFMEVSQ